MPKRKMRKIRVNVQIRFQEILALTVVIPFLVFTVLVLIGERPYTVIQMYVPLIGIILSGYFGQGAIREWRSHTEPIEKPLVEYRPEDEDDFKAGHLPDVDQQYESQQQEYQQEIDINRPPI